LHTTVYPEPTKTVSGMSKTRYVGSDITKFRNWVRNTCGYRGDIRSVFDVGSCHGIESQQFGNIYFNSEVHCFEANPLQIPIVKVNTRNSTNVEVHSCAVTDYDGTTKFYPIDKRLSKSRWFDCNQGAGSLFRTNGNERMFWKNESLVQYEIEVPCTRLDTFCEKKGIRGPQLLWIDAQGSELHVLRGLGKYIEDVDLIHTEMEIVPLYHKQDLYEDIHPWLLDHGFEFVDKQLFRESFGDFIYVRKRT